MTSRLLLCIALENGFYAYDMNSKKISDMLPQDFLVGAYGGNSQLFSDPY